MHPRSSTDGVTVFPHVYVGPAPKLAATLRFILGVFVGDDVEIGADCVLHPNVVVRHGCRIGDRVILHAGVVIGSDGFGYAGRGESRVKILKSVSSWWKMMLRLAQIRPWIVRLWAKR